MIADGKLSLRVRAVEPISPTLKRFVFEPADGGLLPVAAPGSHLQVRMKGESRTWKNAYSLVSPHDTRDHYAIIVRRVAQSRGGSAFMHEQVVPGQVMETAVPGNLFPVSNVARKHLLLSGGIGITPFLSYLQEFTAKGAPFELFHFCREEEVATFATLLAPFDRRAIHFYPLLESMDLAGLLASQPLGTHLYTCGPTGMMNEVLGAAQGLGWPKGKLHSESFGEGSSGGLPFRALLAKSGIEIEVKADESLLEAIEAAGIEAPCLCRGGACGQCAVPLLEGTPEHRDHVLTAEEHAENKVILTCVSRAKSPRIVIDL